MRKNEAAALARLAEDVDFIYAKADGRHSRVGITNDDIIECVISDIQRVATGQAPREVARLIERYRSETTQPAAAVQCNAQAEHRPHDGCPGSGRYRHGECEPRCFDPDCAGCHPKPCPATGCE